MKNMKGRTFTEIPPNDYPLSIFVVVYHKQQKI